MFIILILAVSVCIGLALRNFRFIRHIDRTATWTVWLLIFIFGISLGSNEAIVADFSRFGLSALVLALAGVAGSVVAVCGISRYLDRRDRK